MIPMTPTATERIRQILDDLEAVRENLLALSDDIWLSIDHNDPQALDAGVEFKRAYNAKAAAFDKVASELSSLVQQYTDVRLGAAEQTGADNREQNERIIAELNRNEPHTLDENFTYKRPHGFILDGQGTTGITTWQRMYELVCQQLFARDEGRFQGLCDHPDFISNRGNHTVTRDASPLRKALAVGGGLHIEANLSANGIRDVVCRLLAAYEIPTERMQIFLRQDRDAARDQSTG
jgi:hypothetical protein